MKIHWDKLDKCNIGHNATESFEFHDLCRFLLMKMLRRRYKNKEKYPIYSEFHPTRKEVIPDIYLRVKDDEYIWELQKDCNDKWTMEINSKYENENLFIVPLKPLEKKWKEEVKNGEDPIASLKNLLIVYLI
jgi:hypothetical protein